QTRLRFGQPSAILTTTRDGPLAMTVRANEPRLGTSTVRTDTRWWRQPRVVAEPIGPHLVAVGWFPRSAVVRIVRIDGRGRHVVVASIAGSSSSYRDATVLPNRHYRYVVYRSGFPSVALGPLTTPPDAPVTSMSAIGGKGMWFFFTSNPVDSIYFRHDDPAQIVDQAVRAGLHYVELRFAYGAYWEVSPQVKPTVDAIVDGLAAHGIATIAWTVPRDTSFEDVQATVRAASYRTARGTPVGGVAIDLERGGDFMGGASQGVDALWQYVRDVRRALGPHYVIAATVEDAYMEHLDDTVYPYARIAQFSNVLQPMAYWRMLRHRPTSPSQVRTLLRGSYDTLLLEARRKIAVSMGGQTVAGALGGAPAADEIAASLKVSKRIGAIGECFFDWDGTQPYQWNALAHFAW
ncbi:MAG TPA: hypothetical protein VNG31_01000, partial [Candidatus Baltobacteraceae bacterium]|nr:hypothetical protein [Candidatus Baltobacteraceae bacterium]